LNKSKKREKEATNIHYKAWIAYMTIIAITWILLITPVILGTSIASATTTAEDDSPTTPTTPTEEPEELEPSPAEPPEDETTVTEEPTGGLPPEVTPEPMEPGATTGDVPPAETGPLMLPNATLQDTIRNETGTGISVANQTSNQTLVTNQTIDVTLQNTPENRQLATTIGDLHNQRLAELLRIENETQGNDTKEAELLLQNLTEENLVTPSESQDLDMIVQLLSDNNNQTNTADLINSLSSINNQLTEENASPAAIALSDIALSSAQYWSDKLDGPTGDTGPGTESTIKFCVKHPKFCKVVGADIGGCAKGLAGSDNPDLGDCLGGAVDESVDAASSVTATTPPTSSEPAEVGSTESVIGSNATTSNLEDEDQSGTAGTPQDSTTEQSRRPIGPPTNCTFPPCPGEEEQEGSPFPF
jgi:hypothetical protein